MKTTTFGPHVKDPTERKAHRENRRMALASEMTIPEIIKFQNYIFNKQEIKNLF